MAPVARWTRTAFPDDILGKNGPALGQSAQAQAASAFSNLSARLVVLLMPVLSAVAATELSESALHNCLLRVPCQEDDQAKETDTPRAYWRLIVLRPRRFSDHILVDWRLSWGQACEIQFMLFATDEI